MALEAVCCVAWNPVTPLARSWETPLATTLGMTLVMIPEATRSQKLSTNAVTVKNWLLQIERKATEVHPTSAYWHGFRVGVREEFS